MKYIKFSPRLLTDIKQYSKRKFTADLMAGLIVGIVALPLAIAFGIASGVSPEKGIITAIVAGLIISCFGGSRVQIGGPTGAFIIIIYEIVQQFGESGLMVATFMAGLFLLLLGFSRLGTIIKYIPYPIIVGFTSGIALTIFTTQIKDLLGLRLAYVPIDFIEKWETYLVNIWTLDWWTTGIGLTSIIIIVLFSRFCKNIPGSLVAIVFMTILVYIFQQCLSWAMSVETIGDRFNLSPASTGLHMLEISWETVKQLVPSAVTIAVLGAIESLLSATVADGVTGDRHDSNQELIGQGVANLICPLFGGIPATGAIARTMTNINNGGRTPVAGVVHSFVLLLIFLFLMPLAAYIPMACLAGVLVVVSYNMSSWRTFRELLKNPKSDVVVLFVTFLLTVIFDLTIAIEVGLIIASFLFMKRVSETTEISVITEDLDPNMESDVQLHEEHLIVPDRVEVYEINGPYFFGIANKFEDVMARMGDRPKVRIIRMRKVPFIDSTGIHNLKCLCEMSRKEGIRIVLSGVNERVHKALEHSGFNELLGKEFICRNINEALIKAAELTENEKTNNARNVSYT